MAAATRNPTVEQVRAGIDRGAASDKIAQPDPATAPLGADEEAAGTPPSRADLRTEVSRLNPAPAARSAGEEGGHRQIIVTVLIGLALGAVVAGTILYLG
jgi:hypothetical protein